MDMVRIFRFLRRKAPIRGAEEFYRHQRPRGLRLIVLWVVNGVFFTAKNAKSAKTIAKDISFIEWVHVGWGLLPVPDGCPALDLGSPQGRTRPVEALGDTGSDVHSNETSRTVGATDASEVPSSRRYCR